ncbi:MAG: MlaD family protein [Candidatus Hydrogenedentota bacterium]
MATRKQKIKVGVFLTVCFVLLVTIVTIIAGFIEATGVSHSIRFPGSVSGLYEGAPVQYQGVPVGKVTAIAVNPKNEVVVKINVDPEKATLYRGVKAELVIYSFAAGTMAVSLSGGDPDRGELPPNSTIQARASALTAIGTQAEEVLTTVNKFAQTFTKQFQGEKGEEGLVRKVSSLLDRAQELADNAESLLNTATETIGNADTYMADVTEEASGLSGDIRTFTRNADDMVTEMREKLAVFDVDTMQTDVDRAMRNIAEISEELKSTATGLDDTIAGVEHDVDNVSYALRSTLEDLREALRGVSDLATQVKQDPASLIRGRGAPRDSR